MSFLTMYSSTHDEVQTPPSITTLILETTLLEIRSLQTSSYVPTTIGKTLFRYILLCANHALIFFSWVHFILMDLFFALIYIPLAHTRMEMTTIEAEPFPGSAHVTSTGSFVGSLLLNKKTMFSSKVPKLLGALKLLSFML